MKEYEKVPEKVLVSLTEKFVGHNVNSACFWYLHQTRLPKGYEKLKKNL